ncbi:hypothetical protein AXF42_Ash004688 [Apostasia shenzhenica]|uniref:Uncharacterized protein n=1 Tax=Apostasia shenzhenica TaxID=1088818 RepID=A0A2I0BHC1_9ASPA|nr:hypothetical protein AXF42_Ash004688 [Apostasia shenzhenica]
MKDQSSVRNQLGPGGNPSISSIHGFFSALGSTVRSARQTALLHLNPDPNVMCHTSIDHSTRLRPYSRVQPFSSEGRGRKSRLRPHRGPASADCARLHDGRRCIMLSISSSHRPDIADFLVARILRLEDVDLVLPGYPAAARFFLDLCSSFQAIQLLGTIAGVLYYNVSLTIGILQKVCCLGLISLLKLAVDQLPVEGLTLVFSATLEFLVSYKDQLAEAKEADVEDDDIDGFQTNVDEDIEFDNEMGGDDDEEDGDAADSRKLEKVAAQISLYVCGSKFQSIMGLVLPSSQFYAAIKDELEHINPLAKFLTFKSIVFLTWWQGVAVALLYSLGLVKSPIAQALQFKSSIQDYIICIEMLSFLGFYGQHLIMQNPLLYIKYCYMFGHR